MTFGAFIRTFINEWFWAIQIGQLVIGCSVCFMVNIQIQFCYNWFHPANRPIYISLVSVMSIFGGGIGNLIPLILVNTSEKSIPAIRHSIHGYTYIIFWVCLLMTVAVIFLFKDEPPEGFG